MRLTQTPAIRIALRPALAQTARLQPAHTRLASTSPNSGPESEVGDKGTAKEYNKDGTNPNKNLVYIGAGALALGGVYAMFMGKPEKVAATAAEGSPGEAAQKATKSAAAR